MSSSDTSRYTPPMGERDKLDRTGEESRRSRSRRRINKTRRHRRSVTRSNRRQSKRETYRKRSRSRLTTTTDTTDSTTPDRTLARKRSMHRSRRRRCLSSTDSSNSCDSSSDSSYPSSKRRRRSRSKIRSDHREKRRRMFSGPNKEREFMDNFVRLMNNKGNPFEGAHNVIPEFDPDTHSQSAADWIRKVNETARIYGWSDKQIVYYAIPKLAGQAKKWYQGRSSVDLSWNQWQKKIIKTFPDDRNYADRLSEMLNRRSKREESLEEYFHEKARLVKMCGITGRNAVDCIVTGIFDNGIRLNAQGSSFKRPSQLLKYLRRISKRNIIWPKRDIPRTETRNTDSSRTNSNRTTFREKSRNSYHCFNCSEAGHTARRCPKPLKRCVKCQRLGHESQNCRSNPFNPQGNAASNNNNENKSDNTQNVLQITSTEQLNSKYFKSVTLDNVPCSAYIDFGSQCTLVQEKVADSLRLVIDRTGLPEIKGFAFGRITPIGRVTVTIVVDTVEADVEAYVVPNNLLKTEVLIGQSLTELPTVVVYKTNKDLVLYCDHSEVEKINIFNTETVSVTGSKDIEVHTENDYTGLLFIPGSICLKPGCEHILLQGIYSFKKGKGRCIVLNLSQQGTNLPKSKLMGRGIKFDKGERLLSETKQINVNVIDVTNSSQNSPICTDKEPITLEMLNIGPKVTESGKIMLLDLLNNFRDCFALNLRELGFTSITQMTLHLNDNTPVTYRPYRLPFSERAKVREMVGNLLDNGIIQESQSAYASPIVLVRKKNNEYRMCVDYRALNRKTVKDSYPMPVIDDQLDRLSGKSYFTSLDLASGYHQIPVAEESRHLTAFVTPDGHYEYLRMPFGLVNAPAVFQSMINKALGADRFELAIPYLDDLLSTGSTFQEAFSKLERILELLRKANLTLNLKKCFFFQSHISYLGYEISEKGLKPGEEKIKAVSEFPRPTNVHQIRQFVGLASYFRRFVYNFSLIVRPLTKLTKADAQWQWGDEQENAFQDLKAKLVVRPILALYDPNYITEVHCDASKLGVGGVLLQRPNEETPFKPVAYFSRQTTKEESLWHSYELETMAVVQTLKKFRVFLIGLEFKVITDCNALRSTLTKRDLIPKIARWWLMLQEYNFSIEYRPGHSMQHVDALSRNPVTPPSLEEELEVLNITATDWLHTVQMTDPRIKHIKAILETPEVDLKDISDNYSLRDGKVYRRVGSKLKWVVPNSARWRICQLNHDEAGHFSTEKTLEKIRNDYWFPKMNRFVKKYVEACINCAYNKEMSGKKTGYLHPIPKVNAIFHTIHMDHLGPFIKSKKGNTYILGVIDGFSKFIFVRPVRNTRSKTTIKVLEDIFATFGSPKIIISDQGTSFSSSEFKTFISSIGIKHVFNAVATPRANGQIERYNRTILNSLAAMNHGQDEKDWDSNVAKLQWSLNNTVNKSTGKTPAEIVFGQTTNSQSEGILKGALQTEEQISDSDRLEMRKSVQNRIEERQTKMKENFDKTRGPTRIFKEGDLVMIPNNNPDKGKSKKLAPKFRGPFRVSGVLDKDRYEVCSISGHSKRRYKNIYAADHLKPWITMSHPPLESEGSDEDDSESDNSQ